MDKICLTRNEIIRSPTPPMDSSIEDIDEFRMDQELECLDVGDDEVDVIAGASKKPHFLDYDSIPPPGFEDDINGPSNDIVPERLTIKNAFYGENKIEKKYETDGEISDFELAAGNYKKNTATATTSGMELCESTSKFLFPVINKQQSSVVTETNMGGARRKKHFLDENPIPPDYELEREREHHSLDRNFERTPKEYEIKYERKHSLDRERTKKVKEPSYTLTRFLEHDTTVYRGTWPSDRPNDTQCTSSNFGASSGIGCGGGGDLTTNDLKNLTPKVECVYSLLSMLGGKNQLEMSTKFLELSKSPGTCATLRHSRCIPLIVQMIHSDADEKTKKNATIALHNVVNCHPDDKAGRREAKVLRHIEQIMEYCDKLKGLLLQQRESIADDSERHPLQAICSLMKISFDEEHRHAMCQLGALQAIASLVHYDHAVHGHDSGDERCISLRRYAGMALTNLTFGDGNNKALLCTNREFMKALVAQLNSTADDLLQVTASVLRNLSWRADYNMKTVLNEIGTVTALSKAVMKNKNENTLKALLSALWNLSAHCSTNKAEFCAVDGALAFLCDMLVYEGPSKTLQIIENAGGILRNVSSHIAVREDYRRVLRGRNCLGILLQQLSSESLTVVSNACGTLWNLSARCPEDQKFLLDNKAVSMLSLLIHSKHKMISNGSSAALKNLLNFRPGGVNHSNTDPIVKSMKLKELPSLNVRKQRALEHELDQNLSETCENIEIATPTKEEKTIDDFIPHHYEANNVIRLGQTTTLIRSSENKEPIHTIVAKNDVVYDKQKIGTKVKITEQIKCKKDTITDSQQAKELTEQRSHDFKQQEQPIQNVRHSIKKSVDNTFTATNSTVTKNTTSQTAVVTSNSGTYQETDLDQITDFSLRYAENQHEELDDDDDDNVDNDDNENNRNVENNVEEAKTTNTDEYGNEILLIVEDSVKCYQTEGTPYVISNAPSVSDLRNAKVHDTTVAVIKNNKPTAPLPKTQSNLLQNSGINTPEKPTKYCEEGTPGYFSRCDSFNSLNDGNITTVVNQNQKENDRRISNTIISPSNDVMDGGSDVQNPTIPGASGGGSAAAGSSSLQKAVTFADYAQETPLMFSRHSSLDSLSSVEPAIGDDRSSVVSDFSRLASGIISPSEIPDSPTQIVSNSPRRTSTTPYTNNQQQQQQQQLNSKPIARLRSVFEDDVNTFGVENTPAQFSTATSLSNLSLLEDEPKITSDVQIKEQEENTPDIIDTNLNKSTHELDDIAVNLASITIDENESDLILSDSEESDGDNLLFQNCINLGMNSMKCGNLAVTTNQASVGVDVRNDVEEKKNEPLLSDDSTSSSDAANDNLLEQCIRDGIQKTIATNPKNREQLRNILPKTLLKENPIGMLRKGGISAYIPPADEISKFNVEDSPCNYSVLSGLSDISVGSGVARLVKLNRDSTNMQAPVIVDATQNNDNYRRRDDSLSSISLDSEDDTHILNQAIVAGSMSKIKPTLRAKVELQGGLLQNTIKPADKTVVNQIDQQNQYQFAEGNDSLSSIDSTDSNDHHTHILEECIRSGMHRDPKSKSKLPLTERFTNKSPTKTTQNMIQYDSEWIRERKNNLHKLNNLEIKQTTRHVKSVLIPSTDYTQRLLNVNLKDNLNIVSKNGETTSAAALGIITATVTSASSTASGVEMEQHPVDGTKEPPKRNRHINNNHNSNNIYPSHIQPMNNNKIGSNPEKFIDSLLSPNLRATTDCVLEMSFGSLNLSSDGTAGLDMSNEYPALKLSSIELNDDSHQESSFEMEMSNEYLMERPDEILSPKIDKHKDPDLMLKSVDRLTQELVSTAEYLRTTTTSTINDNEITAVYENKSSSNSNTWNEDTCPNDVSFPSISMTAPMIASMNDDDATYSDTNFMKFDIQNSKPEQRQEEKIFDVTEVAILNDFKYDHPEIWLQNSSLESSTLKLETFSNSQPDSLDTDCQTIIEENTKNNDIEFQLGGAVQSCLVSPATMTASTFNICTATMTKSDIIAIEANKLVSELIDMQNMSDSCTSLDLDNIRPPSGMDCISLTGISDIPNSPQLGKVRKKSLPFGIMARRALNHAIPSGSLESVNSSCNLDNIKPPSLMDELLDSMISVSSITSEVLDFNTANMNMTSHYDTALSDADDTTTISMDLSMDQQLTPMPSDISSAECTPKKVKSIRRTLTPRQKRHIVKDRYRTYTIAADIIVKEKIDELRNMSDVSNSENELMCDDETTLIEDQCTANYVPIVSKQEELSQDSPLTTLNAPVKERRTIKQIRNDNKERYLTQIVKHFIPSVANCNTSTANSNNMLSTSDIDASITALTDKLHNIPIPSNYLNNFDSNGQHGGTKPIDNDLSSIDFEQNSETESCDQNHCIDEDTYTVSKQTSTVQQHQLPKIKPKIIVPSSPIVGKIQQKSQEQLNHNEHRENGLEIDKAIRGRKKLPYISPYRRTIATTTGSNISGGTNRTNLPVRNAFETKKAVATKLSPKNQNVVAKTHVLINKTMLTNKIKTAKTGVAKCLVTGKKNVLEKNAINARVSQMEPNKKIIKISNDEITAMPSPSSLERQGTFIKVEPTNDSVPIVSPTKTNQSLLANKSKLPSKLPTGKSMIPTSPSKCASTINNPKQSPTKLKQPTQTKLVNSNSTTILNSPGKPSIGSRTNSIGSTINSTSPIDTSSGLKRRTIGYLRSPSTPNVPQRSNSNASLRLIKQTVSSATSTQPPSRSNSNLMQSKQTREHQLPQSSLGNKSTTTGLLAKKSDESKFEKQQTQQKFATPSTTASSSTKVRRFFN